MSSMSSRYTDVPSDEEEIDGFLARRDSGDGDEGDDFDPRGDSNVTLNRRAKGEMFSPGRAKRGLGGTVEGSVSEGSESIIRRHRPMLAKLSAVMCVSLLTFIIMATQAVERGEIIFVLFLCLASFALVC